MPSIEWSLLVTQWVTFLIALFIVWKAAWKPIVKIMAERNEKIKKSIESAEQARVASQQLEEEYKHRLEQIKVKSVELINISRLEAERIREELLKKYQQEAEDIIAKAREELSYERSKLIAELRTHIVDSALAIAEKAIRANSETLQKRKFEEMLAALESETVQAKVR